MLGFQGFWVGVHGVFGRPCKVQSSRMQTSGSLSATILGFRVLGF